MKQRGGRFGASLIGLLMLSSVLFTVLMVAAGGWSFLMGANGRSSAQEGARHLAESTAQLAVAKLCKNADLNSVDFPSLELSLSAYEGGTGRLALDPKVAATLEVPKSLNNLKGAGAEAAWDGGVVQPGTANLVAVGRWRGAEEKIEIVLNVPQFPYVVGSSVPLKGIDGLHVFGLKSPGALSGGFDQIPSDQIVAGHIVTNADDLSGQAALQLLGHNTKIEGDAKAKGQVTVGQGAVVTGAVRPNSTEVPLPKVDIASLDVTNQINYTALSSPSLASPQLTGFNRYTGDLSITGGLDLNGSVVYVDGNLDIQGGLKGKGALLSTGKVTVVGGGSLTGDNQTAIVAKGDVKIHGSQGSQSEFRGMLYTEGNLDCKYTKIAGSVVVNNKDSSGSAVLEQVELAESPEMAKLQIEVKQVKTAPTEPAFGGWLDPTAGGGVSLGSGTVPMLHVASCNWDALGNDDTGYAIPSGVDPTSIFGGQLFCSTDGGCEAVSDGSGGVQVRSINNHFPYGTPGVPVWGKGFSDTPSLKATIVELAGLAGQSISDAEAEQQAQAYRQAALDTTLPVIVQKLNERAAYRKALAEYNAGVAGQSSSWTTLVPFSIDFSKFFKFEDRIRILSWRRR